MAAAAITPTMVQKEQVPTNIIYGAAERRLMKLYLEGPKATQADWFLLSSYLSTAECANIFSIYVIADGEAGSANVPVLDTFTYTSADAKVVAAGAVTGKSRAIITYWTE
jgi:hypothetical protein